MNPHEFLDSKEIEIVQANFITRVYSWMSLALVITGMVALYTAYSPTLLSLIFGNRLVFYGLIIGELILVSKISRSLYKMSPQSTTLAFVFYAILNGLTLASIFVVFTSASIASTFFITSATFGIMSVIGHVTKKDLTKLGNLFVMAIIGLIIASLVNMFLNSSVIYWITTYIGIIIFVGLTAYDSQKIKRMSMMSFENEGMEQKLAITGALSLYLNFINLFLFLLRIFGRRK